LGFRIDTAKGVPPSDWEIIYSKVNKNYRGEKAFIHQEVMYPFSDNSYKNYSSFGLISNFDYGVQIGKSFRNVDGQSTRLIPDFIRTGILKSSESITLIENHDKERDYDGDTNYALSRINNAWWYKQAIAFNLLYPFGSPLIHSGFRITYINSSYSVPISAPMNSYGDLISIGEIKNNVCPDSWTCQHRWPEVAALVQTRSYLNKLIQPDTPLPDIYTEDRNRIYWSVLNKTFVAINSAQGNETAQTWSKFVQTGLPMGTYCNIMYAYSSGGKCVLLPGVVLTSEQWTYSVNSTGHTFLKIGQADRSRVVVLVDNSLTNDAVRLMPWIFWIILFACL
jgi:alpha-amylase